MKKFTPEQVLEVFKKKGYSVDSTIGGRNMFGIRNNDALADTFDDSIGILWMNPNTSNWDILQFDATTDPGSYYRLKPMNVNGSAIIIPGQYKNVYKIGLHQGYSAMQQVAPIDYVRDNNKDKILDFLYKKIGFKKYREIAATNIHHASNTSKSTLDFNWSAGCQVIADIKDFQTFMNTMREGTKFLYDYTLLEIENF